MVPALNICWLVLGPNGPPVHSLVKLLSLCKTFVLLCKLLSEITDYISDLPYIEL